MVSVSPGYRHRCLSYSCPGFAPFGYSCWCCINDNVANIFRTCLMPRLRRMVCRCICSKVLLISCVVMQTRLLPVHTKAIRQPPRRPPLAVCDAEDAILKEMLESGVVEPSNSLWASPVCLEKEEKGHTLWPRKMPFQCRVSKMLSIVWKETGAMPRSTYYPGSDHSLWTQRLVSGYWHFSQSGQ